MKFMHYKSPKAGEDITEEQREEYSTKLKNFLGWLPMSILDRGMRKFYNESPCFKELIKNIVDGKE